MEKNFRWAVCGLGRISRKFVKTVKAMRGMEIAACVSSSKERAKKYAEKYGIKSALTYDELAANPALADAAYVCSETSRHQKHAMKFIEAGLPVLCEKPLSYDLASSAAMTELARERGVLLMEAMWTRFLPATRFAVETAEGGSLGKITGMRGRFFAGVGHLPGTRVFDKASAGGSVLDLAVYLAAYAYMLLGKPQNIEAEGKVKDGVDRYCNFVLDYGGVKARLGSSFKFLAVREKFVIELEKGEIIIPRFYGARRVVVRPYGGKNQTARFENVPGFSYEIEHFRSLVESGAKESPVMTHESSLAVMSILDRLNERLGVNFSQLTPNP